MDKEIYIQHITTIYGNSGTLSLEAVDADGKQITIEINAHEFWKDLPGIIEITNKSLKEEQKNIWFNWNKVSNLINEKVK